MTTKRWLGQATAASDYWQITVTGTVASVSFAVTINGKSIVYNAGGSDTTSTVIAGIVALWTSLTSPPPPEFQELTPVVSGTNYIYATGNTPGNPCTISVSTPGGAGGADFSITHLITATGPNDFNNNQNWSGGVAPTNSDTLVFDTGSVSCQFNIGTTLTGITLVVSSGYTGQIGLPAINTNAQTTYAEYRTQYLTLAGGTATINAPGVKLCNLAFGSNTATINVQSTGTRLSQYIPPLLITGGNGSSTLSITKGDVGVAFYMDQTADFPTILTSYQSSATSDVTLYCGTGATLGAITKDGGTLTVNSNATTLLQGTGGGTTIIAAGNVTTAYCEAGSLVWNSVGTLGTVTVSGNGVLDFSQDPNGKTVTNPILVYGNSASVNDPWKVVNSGVLSVTTLQTTFLNVTHGSGNVCSFT